MMRLGFRIARTTIALLFLAKVGWTHPRIKDNSVWLEHPVYATVVGVGLYNPESIKSGVLAQPTLGLRYVEADKKNPGGEAFAYQLSANAVSADNGDIYGIDVEVFQFLPRASFLPFDHHFFYGAGIGSSMVQRRNNTNLLLPAFLFDVGLQSRIRDWYLEPSLQVVIGPKRSVFDISGLVSRIAVVYYFDP